MNKLGLMLADMDVADIIDAQKHMADSRLYEMLVTFGAIAAAIIVAVIWAVLYSLKKKKRKHHKHRKHREEPALHFANAETESESPPAETKVRKKWKRQRRPHRPLNPTLAQTRGLPPMRDENTPLPPMP